MTEEKTVVYGLENAYGYGRALAVWLLEKGHAVKDVNTALSYAQIKSVPMYQKSDSYDAEAVALVLINMLDKLPDAVPDDAYWTLSQLVNRRDNICSHQHNNCSVKRAEKILELVRTDGQTVREYQASRDAITRSIAGDLEHYREQLEIVETAIETMMPSFNCTLMTMPGVDVTTAANMLAEIGDINRFPNANKMAKFAGICPINFSSSGKVKNMCPKQGNRRLQAIFYFLAIQMIQASTNGTPRNKVFREYYMRRVAEGKNKQQALICIARRLVNIVYGMLKNHTEYREPEQ